MEFESQWEFELKYTGQHKLWMDHDKPPILGDITATLEDGVLRWRWAFKDKHHEGQLHLDGSSWNDSFHQNEPQALELEPSRGARVAAGYVYGPTDQPWSWRISVSDRPDGSMLVQMTNFTPWGEGHPAVEWVLTPQG